MRDKLNARRRNSVVRRHNGVVTRRNSVVMRRNVSVGLDKFAVLDEYFYAIFYKSLLKTTT